MSAHIKKIVLEEHFNTPSLAPYIDKEIASIIKPDFMAMCKERLVDLDQLRLEEMDKYGIDMSVLSVTAPGVQIEPDLHVAVKKSKEVNDFLAGVIQKHPTRYSGFAHLALQDPKGAADELERGVKHLGLRGALINGHTNGEYLDDEKFYPLWERAEELGVPIYIHPANAPEVSSVLKGYPEMIGAGWGWGTETAGHALRLVFGGLFDRFPKTTVILGHMGEMLPFVLWRLDSRYAVMKPTKQLKKKPSQYIRENIMITTAGAFDAAPLICSILALGSERIMFSVDYPYEYTKDAVHFIENAPISPSDKEKICHGNVQRLLKL